MSTRNYNDENYHYFQTASSQSKSERRTEKAKNNAGNPLKLNAKLSAVIKDGKEDGVVFVGDNGGGVRRVDLKSNKTTHTYRGPRHPVTSLTTDPTGTTLFAGCWDKTIWSWDIATATVRRNFIGHSDFVNCVTCGYIALPEAAPRTSSMTDLGEGQDDGVGGEVREEEEKKQCLLLFSGSVDASIIAWRASTGERLHTLKGHTRGVLDLAIDPLSQLLASPPTSGSTSDTHSHTIYLFSASSTPEIRCWRITYASAGESTSTLSAHLDDPGTTAYVKEEESTTPESAPFTLHATSVNKLLFFPSSSSAGSVEYDLFTASSDNTAQCLSRPLLPSPASKQTSTSSKPPKWTTSDTFTHPDWVRSIAHDPSTGMLVTGCRDEEVRVWDTSSGECVRTLMGHFDSVEGVCVVQGLPAGGKGAVGGKWTAVVSVSLDGTLRRWGIDGEDEGVVQVEDGVMVEKEGGSRDKDDEREEADERPVFTTEDEDKELADLMAELEDDD